MYLEEAAWLRRELGRLEVADGDAVLNVASSTEHYRTVEQPHNETEVLGPLRARGAEIVNLDLTAAPGVDVVCDLLAPDLDLRRELGRAFSIVLATGLLEHLPESEVPRILERLQAVVGPEGHLVLTTPFKYRRTKDPVDYGYRPSPESLLELLLRDRRFAPVKAELVRIDAPQYYKGFISRASVVPVGGRWVPLPGGSEQLRRLIKAWRWQETCVIAAATR